MKIQMEQKVPVENLIQNDNALILPLDKTRTLKEEEVLQNLPNKKYFQFYLPKIKKIFLHYVY